MSGRRRKFSRKLGTRRYRKIFFIASEGVKTEPQYFALFTNRERSVKVSCLKAKKGASPPQVLERMETFIKSEGLLDSDEAWLVTDKDAWTNEQLAQLHAWSHQAKNYGFCLSNPKFEYWLLLHFEDAKGVADAKTCDRRLESHLPGYDKGIPPNKITPSMIQCAVDRAKAKDAPPCPDWPRNIGSTVYRLVENILTS